MLAKMSAGQGPKNLTASSQGRPWTLTIVMLVLAINFIIETVHDLPALTPALWFHLAAALFTAYAFIQNLRTAVRRFQHRQKQS